MKRRELIRTLAAGLLGAAFRIHAQQSPPRMARVGFVNDVLLGPTSESVLDAFKQGLREHGWVEGKNLTLVFRYAETPEQRPQISAELAGLHLDVIVATWEQVPVDVVCHHDRRMPHTLLHDLRRQAEAAVFDAIDAPRGIEVPQRMQTGVFRL